MIFADLDREMWLWKRLREHGAAIFDGVTDRQMRKERAREAINQVGALVVAGRGKDRKPMTYKDLYEIVYGEAL